MSLLSLLDQKLDVYLQGYLNSEEVVGKVLAGKRRDVVLASKWGTRVPQYTAEDVEVSLTQSLQKLQTDYLDLYQVVNSVCFSQEPSPLSDPSSGTPGCFTKT